MDVFLNYLIIMVYLLPILKLEFFIKRKKNNDKKIKIKKVTNLK